MSKNERLLITTFELDPRALLVVAPRGLITMPPLQSPFVRAEVSEAFGGAGIPATVVDGHPGRWTDSIQRAHSAAKNARRQREQQDMATKAAILRGSDSPLQRSRAEAIQRRMRVDEELREAKLRLSQARGRFAETGERMNSREYRQLEERLEALKDESQALMVRLGELKREEAAVSRDENETLAGRFKKVAYRMLDPETFEKIENAALDEE